VSQEQLKLACFPLGDKLKPDVRNIAAELDLATADRKDSQGICFVGKVDLPTFLQQKLKGETGDIVEIPKTWDKWKDFPTGLPRKDISDKKLEYYSCAYQYEAKDGTVAGQHKGAIFYTIGQRKGLNVGGKEEPLFVIALDTQRNHVYVGQGHDHPGLNRKGLLLTDKDTHWLREDMKLNPGESREMMVRIRYRQPLQKAVLFAREKGLYIIFDQLQRGIAPGQFAAWYEGDELIGSGVIK
jgi:tRNA-specific 2-thiouridylase